MRWKLSFCALAATVIFVSCFSLSVSFGMASGKFFSFVFVVYDS